MPETNVRIFGRVKFTAEGWHCWPDAPERRDYLRARHRHLFYVEVLIEMKHMDREVEYHDLLDAAKAAFPEGEFGPQACEMLASSLAKDMHQAYPGRRVEVSVSEDGECGAIVTLEE